MACYYDAGSHPDGTGLSLPLRQEHVRGTGLDPITGNPVLDPTTHTPITYAPVDALRISHTTVEPPEVLPVGRSLADICRISPCGWSTDRCTAQRSTGRSARADRSEGGDDRRAAARSVPHPQRRRFGA